MSKTTERPEEAWTNTDILLHLGWDAEMRTDAVIFTRRQEQGIKLEITAYYNGEYVVRAESVDGHMKRVGSANGIAESLQKAYFQAGVTYARTILEGSPQKRAQKKSPARLPGGASAISGACVCVYVAL